MAQVGAIHGRSVASLMGFEGGIFPGFGFTIVAPEPMFNSARWLRIHRKIMKNVLKTVLLEWHASTLKEHFVQGAKAKYGYKERQETTKRIKQAKRRHNIDLIDSGKTARSMRSKMPTVKISGQGDRYMEGVIRYRFPFPVSRDAKDPRHVSMAQMGIEIGTWTEEEMQWATYRFAQLYAKEMEFELDKSPRMRKQATAAGF